MLYMPYTGLATADLPPAISRRRRWPAPRPRRPTRASAIRRSCRSAALSSLGRVDEAKAVALRVLELEPNFTVAEFVRAHTGRADIWEPIGEALRHLGLLE